MLQVRERVHPDTDTGEALPAEKLRVLHESYAQSANGVVFPESSGFLWSEDSERVQVVAPISAQRRIDVADDGLKRFSDEMPTCKWFVFVDPLDPERWVVGWKDTYHIREEGSFSYRHDDPRLTWWYPLPDVPHYVKQ